MANQTDPLGMTVGEREVLPFVVQGSFVGAIILILTKVSTHPVAIDTAGHLLPCILEDRDHIRRTPHCVDIGSDSPVGSVIPTTP